VADNYVPTWPALRVSYPDTDIHPDEPGLVSVHDEKTGETTIQEADRFYYGPPKQ
jgi:hypothetical protein